MTNRKKARVLSAVGVSLGYGAMAFLLATDGGCWWPLRLVALTFYSATCAIAGVAWWATRP